jgi:hypothetical protein
VNIVEIPCSNEAMTQLVSLRQEQMLDDAGIKEFFYNPFTEKRTESVLAEVKPSKVESTSAESTHAPSTIDLK